MREDGTWGCDYCDCDEQDAIIADLKVKLKRVHDMCDTQGCPMADRCWVVNAKKALAGAK